VSACPSCGAAVSAGDEFCEACGEALSTTSATATTTAVTPKGADPARPTVTESLSTAPMVADARTCACGGTFDADGWCDRCGQRATNGRDHLVEIVSPTVAAVTDKGRHHPRNEDAYALAASGGRVVLVVCDGVSSATDSDIAAVAAADRARDVLMAASGPTSESPAARVERWTDVMVDATKAANADAASTAGRVGGENPPSCTFAAALVDGELIVAGWVGDSRVYWIGDDGAALQMSTDDSWATEQVAHGMPRELAEADPQAHSITRWLGVDAPNPIPSCASLAAPGAGWVLVCSDGLWNYCSGASDLAALIHAQDPGAPVEKLAATLVDWANDQGGHDNITVALARLTQPSSTTPAVATSEPEPVAVPDIDPTPRPAGPAPRS
jgi:serine/threonine protein phosphatase PrpC